MVTILNKYLTLVSPWFILVQTNEFSNFRLNCQIFGADISCYDKVRRSYSTCSVANVSTNPFSSIRGKEDWIVTTTIKTYSSSSMKQSILDEVSKSFEGICSTSPFGSLKYSEDTRDTEWCKKFNSFAINRKVHVFWLIHLIFLIP